MSEILKQSNNLEGFTTKQLAESIRIRTGAQLGYEDGTPDPLTPSWEASAPFPQDIVAREIISRVTGEITPDEAIEVSSTLSKAEKMLRIDNAYLTSEQITDKKRIVAVNGYIRSSLGEGTRTGENLSNPWSEQPKFDNSPVSNFTGVYGVKL